MSVAALAIATVTNTSILHRQRGSQQVGTLTTQDVRAVLNQPAGERVEAVRAGVVTASGQIDPVPSPDTVVPAPPAAKPKTTANTNPKTNDEERRDDD